jgi:IgGFc binding protein
LADTLKGKDSKVWGDRNATNGCAPNVVTCTDAADLLMAGNTIQILQNITIPRNKYITHFDGGDYMMASYPVTVTKAAFASKPGSVLAGAVEVLDTEQWGTEFDIPVGGDGLDRWEFVRAYFMAKDPNTVISVNGVAQKTLGKGQSWSMTGTTGQKVTTSNPVQVHVVTGHLGSHYECRWYSLITTEAWTNDYTSAVGDSYGRTKVHLFNPSSSMPVKVNVTTRRSNGQFDYDSLTIPARNTALTEIIPDNSGCRMIGNGNFIAFSVTDSEVNTKYKLPSHILILLVTYIPISLYSLILLPGTCNFGLDWWGTI